MTELAKRRRAIMARAKPLKNGLLPGTYSLGASQATVNSDGSLTINSWDRGWGADLRIPFRFPIDIVSGDVVRMDITKVSGNITPAVLAYVGITSPPYSTQVWLWQNTSLESRGGSMTKTATSTFTATRLRMECNSATTVNNWTVNVEIYVNGVKVIPEE